MLCLDAGDYLLREGDAPTSGFLIESGSVEVVLERPEGDRVLAVLESGQIVGEMALVDSSPRTASVRAREKSVLLPITAEHITKRLEAADPVLRLVLGTVLDRFRATLRGLGGGTPADRQAARPELQTDLAAITELRLEKDLHSAIQTGEIVVYYQPIVRVSNGRLAGFEALARWPHATRGLVPPSTFVPVAETSGLSVDLARLCLDRVMRDLPALRKRAAARHEHVDSPRIAVNISGQDLMCPGFAGHLAELAGRTPGGVTALTLELTETALVRNPGEAALALAQARKLGFQIAVDDFGTGYSSLNYIRTLPIDTLKIDKSFVQSMTDCETTRSIVASTLQLADSLGLKVVGEGIETRAQHSLLQMLGCEFGQGYLFGRPAPLDQTLALISTWRSTKVADPVICAPSA